jgi:hypothetical protein
MHAIARRFPGCLSRFASDRKLTKAGTGSGTCFLFSLATNPLWLRYVLGAGPLTGHSRLPLGMGGLCSETGKKSSFSVTHVLSGCRLLREEEEALEEKKER